MLGALAVAAGAVGAHALADTLPPARMAVWSTAADYHLLHAIVLLVLGLCEGPWRARRRLCQVACAAFVTGIVLFSGSLYALCLSGLTALGAVAPLGGLALITGWLALAGLGLSRIRA
jgi:uncharacterized membrane protein YgdD (TMEM256/DUF423 family)